MGVLVHPPSEILCGAAAQRWREQQKSLNWFFFIGRVQKPRLDESTPVGVPDEVVFGCRVGGGGSAGSPLQW